MDFVDVLRKIIDCFKDHETEEGFIDSEPCEYFYAYSLALISTSVQFTRQVHNSSAQRVKDYATESMCGMHPITRAVFIYFNSLKNFVSL